MIVRFAASVAALSALQHLTHALYTPKGSACTIECATNSANFTGTSDLVCLDTAYTSSTQGITLKSCIECLSTSTYVNTTLNIDSNSDQWWYLWHMKYVQQYCLIDTPQTTAAANCSSECTPMSNALDVSWIYEGVQPQYGYCSFNGSQYGEYSGDCAKCMQSQQNGVVIGNFAEAMNGACSSMPFISTGGTVATARDLFNSSTLPAGTTPTSASTSTSTSAATSASTSTSPAASTAASASQASTPSSKSSLSPGAAAGIGVGVSLGVLAIAAVVAIFLVMRRRKKRPLTSDPPIKNESYQSSQPTTPEQLPKYLSAQSTELAATTHPYDTGVAEVKGNEVHEADDGRGWVSQAPQELPGFRY